MTLTEIKTSVASILGKTPSDLTVNGQDLFLVAINQARMQAELANDFEFNRQQLTLSVNTITGGSLAAAVLYGTSTVATIKTILDVGLYDTNANFRPIEWTTVGEGLERVRQMNHTRRVRYPSDGDLEWLGQAGRRRITFVNGSAYFWPKAEVGTGEAVTVGLEAFVLSSDWNGTLSVAVTLTTGVTGFNSTYYLNGTYNDYGLWLNFDPTASNPSPTGDILRALWNGSGTWWMTVANDIGSAATGSYASVASALTTPASLVLTPDGVNVTGTPTVSAITSTLPSTNDIWLTYGAQYLIWQTVVFLNHRFKTFVPRTEGNLSPPQDKADVALAAFIEWDSARFEQHRRHTR